MSNGHSHAEHYPGPLHNPPGEEGRSAQGPRAARASSEAAASLRRHGPAARGVDPRDVGVPRHRNHVLRRPVHGLPDVPLGQPERVPGSQRALEQSLGRRQHDHPDRQLADDGDGGAFGADEREAKDAGHVARLDDDLRNGVPRGQVHRVRRQVHAPPGAGAALPVDRPVSRPAPRSSIRSTSA